MTTPALPPHPAATRSFYERQFTARDRLDAVPDLPDDDEGAVLLRLKTNPKTYWIDQQPTVSERLRLMRLRWWGWATSVLDHAISELTPAGDAALGRYLDSKAMHSRGQKYTLLRRKYYPKPGECRQHPGADKTEFRKLFTDRDRMVDPPSVPDDREGRILLGFRVSTGYGGYSYITQWNQNTNVREYRGVPAEHKLAVMRCQWWGWLGGQDWKKAGPLTEAGNLALKAWLETQEGSNPDLKGHRVEFFPTQADLDAQKRAEEEAERRKQAAMRRHEALHALHCSDIDLGHDRHRITSRMTAIAMELGAGANNVDDLLAELRTLHQEKLEVERKVAKNDEERERIKQKGDV